MNTSPPAHHRPTDLDTTHAPGLWVRVGCSTPAAQCESDRPSPEPLTGTMARKPTPLVFTSTASSNDGGASAINEPPQSAHSVRSPGTPRSFRFSKKPSLANNPENLSEMQASEQQHQFPQSARIPSSPHQDSLGNQQQPDGSTIAEGQRAYTPSTSPQRTGFFANMKASKSSNRLQQAEAERPATRDRTISKDSVHQGGPGAGASSDAPNNSMISSFVSNPNYHAYVFCFKQILGTTDPPHDDPLQPRPDQNRN